MTNTTQETMRAAAIDRFGGVETLSLHTLPIPEPDPDEILINVQSAGVGVWDPYEREGLFAEMLGTRAKFPYVLGSDGAGTVEAVGAQVSRFKKGDRVFASSFASPKGGFYAEYAVVKAENAAHVPDKLTTEQAGALMVDAITALRGLDDTIGLKKGESLLVFGASGGIGHIAVQLAQRMGARVLAVASGEDGVELVRRLGVEAVVDGHNDDVAAAARAFAPQGVDTALLTAGGDETDKALKVVRDQGRVAYPNGVRPVPQAPDTLTVKSYDGTPDPQAIAKVIRLIEAGPFMVHIARTFPLEYAGDAHRALMRHYVGKLALRP